MRTYPFLGKGVSFPFRVNRVTGDIQTSEGNTDDMSVALRYMGDSWTIREPLDVESNLVADAVFNILFTAKREHDTLPEYGSNIHHLLFEPITPQVFHQAAYYFAESTKRWEKRVSIDEDTGVLWKQTPEMADMGETGLLLKPEFIAGQKEGNLVYPFVNDETARTAEYTKGTTPSTNIYDSVSRYVLSETYFEDDGVQHTRTVYPQFFQPDATDIFHRVTPTDTWLLIAFDYYGDVRLWWAVVGAYVWDVAEKYNTRDYLDLSIDLPVGEILRLPALSRVFQEIG